MKFAPLLLLSGILIAGCNSKPAAEAPAPSSNPTTTESAPASGTETVAEITTGMTMADVKKIKGAPTDTKHDHGPNGSELDFWVYDDITIKFQDGKVVE